MSRSTAPSLQRITRRAPETHPTCESGRDLAFRLWDFMQVAAERAYDPWTTADQVAFARSVVPLLSRWESAEADARFAELIPGYAGEDEDPDAGFEVFDGTLLQQEVSRA